MNRHIYTPTNPVPWWDEEAGKGKADWDCTSCGNPDPYIPAHEPNVLDITGLMDKGRKRRGWNAPSDDECLLCGKPVGRNPFRVHAVNGTVTDLIPADEPYHRESDDMGWWAVGSECVKQLPAGYATREPK